MNKIIISNQGLIVPEDLVLIGSSTKRGSTNKIGMFGSGWKYALAWLLRNNVEIEVYSGLEKIEITTKSVTHRSNELQVIVVNGKESSLTTDMGPKWTGWMALREILSNAIDEGDHKIDVIWNPEIQLKEGITQIVVPTNNELAEVMIRYEKYFSFNRETKYSYKHGRVFLKKEESPMNVYRKGIRCYDSVIFTGKIDIDFDNIEINESRLSSSTDISSKCRLIMSEPNLHKEVFIEILKSGFTGWLPYEISDHLMTLVKDLFASGYNFHCNAVIALCGLSAVKENSLCIPNRWWESLVENKIVESVFETANGNSNFFRTDSFDTTGIEYHLSSIRCKKTIRVGKFESPYTEIQIDGDVVFISDKFKGNDLNAAATIIQNMEVSEIEALLSK